MAPVGFVAHLRSLYAKESEDPVISTRTAATLSILLTLFYVVPLYLFSSTRPTPSLSRDAPSVIRARMRTVTATSAISALAVLLLLLDKGNVSLPEALKLLGWWPIAISDVLSCLLLTALLFAGPLFEKWAVGEWREEAEKLSGWIGWRNYVAGPVSEELIFRSAIIPLHLLAKASPGRIVFLAPLYFGIAHVHHFYEFRLTHPGTPVAAALLRSIFQFGYTTVFGWYATFLYLRTGSLLAIIIVHSFCNYCGLPRLWGRLEIPVYVGPGSLRGKEDADPRSASVTLSKSGNVLTVTYYALLIAGAITFYFQFWPLTESHRALASFTATA